MFWSQPEIVLGNFHSPEFPSAPWRTLEKTAKERRGIGSDSSRKFQSEISILRKFRVTGISGDDLYRNFRVVDTGNSQNLGGAINTPSLTQEQLALRFSLRFSLSYISWKLKSSRSPNPPHPNPLIFGGLEEKAWIYIFTEAICISSPFTWGLRG